MDAYVASATVDTPKEGEDTLTLIGDDVTNSVANLKVQIDDEITTLDDALSINCEDAIDEIILAKAKSSAKLILYAYRSDEDFTQEGDDGNQMQMENAKFDGETAIDMAESIDSVRAALKAAKEVCKDIPNDQGVAAN